MMDGMVISFFIVVPSSFQVVPVFQNNIQQIPNYLIFSDHPAESLHPP